MRQDDQTGSDQSDSAHADKNDYWKIEENSMQRIIRHIIRSFGLVERILRDRLDYFAETNRSQKLPGTIGKLLTVTVLGFAVVGFVAGLSGRNLVQALTSTVKLPFLFLASGLICLPTLYYFSVLFGSRLRFLQTITLILTAQTVSATLTLGFTPISLLFWVSGADSLFLVALNSAVLGLSAALGLIFLVQGVLYIQEVQPPSAITFFTWTKMLVKGTLRSLVLMGWLAIYGLVGAQLSWMLRPFFGVPLQGNSFWSSMSNMILQLLR
jgi:hypothetical protein